MEDLNVPGYQMFIESDGEEEEFRSCLGEEDVVGDPEESFEDGSRDEIDVVGDPEESLEDGSRDEIDENAWKMFFKGTSIKDSATRLSGIGIVLVKPKTGALHRIQKRLEFYVENTISEHLALMDGLMEAHRRDMTRVYAFTDSDIIYDQISKGARLEDKLVAAFRERNIELASKLEFFMLKLAPISELKEPLQLSQEAIGLSLEGDGSIEKCLICRGEKNSSQMIRMKCSHCFCSNCMTKYVDGRIQSLQIPIKCPKIRCKYYISAPDCKSFLPVSSYASLEKALLEYDFPDFGNVYCPYSDCSKLLDTHQCLSTRASASSQSESTCVECPECRRLVCIDCVVPWHALMSCEEFENLPVVARDAQNITLHHIAENERWRQCQQCRRMLELSHGCYHLTCWCGHEFCYACGSEYRDGHQTCQCAFWDSDSYDNLDVPSLPEQDPEPWRWDTFDYLPNEYSDQERSQLALIQRFLAGGFSLTDHPSQSPPCCSDSYVDTIKDLHQLPWLERFVSVISDNYYEEFAQ